MAAQVVERVGQVEMGVGKLGVGLDGVPVGRDASSGSPSSANTTPRLFQASLNPGSSSSTWRNRSAAASGLP